MSNIIQGNNSEIKNLIKNYQEKLKSFDKKISRNSSRKQDSLYFGVGFTVAAIPFVFIAAFLAYDKFLRKISKYPDGKFKEACIVAALTAALAFISYGLERFFNNQITKNKEEKNASLEDGMKNIKSQINSLGSESLFREFFEFAKETQDLSEEIINSIIEKIGPNGERLNSYVMKDTNKEFLNKKLGELKEVGGMSNQLLEEFKERNISSVDLASQVPKKDLEVFKKKHLELTFKIDVALNGYDTKNSLCTLEAVNKMYNSNNKNKVTLEGLDLFNNISKDNRMGHLIKLNEIIDLAGKNHSL